MFSENERIRIPFTVLQELDYHKDNNSDLALKKCAAFACKQIETESLRSSKAQDLRFAVESRDYPELLPNGFTTSKHDHLILSAALRYKALSPKILTDDTNFRNIARTQDIKAVAWTDFIKSRGGKAERGQGASKVTGGVEAQDEAKDILGSDDLQIAEKSIDALLFAPLAVKGRIFGMTQSELSMLHSHKVKTCGDLINLDEQTIRGMYNKKKAFMANHLLEIQRKLKAEVKNKQLFPQ